MILQRPADWFVRDGLRVGRQRNRLSLHRRSKARQRSVRSGDEPGRTSALTHSGVLVGLAHNVRKLEDAEIPSPLPVQHEPLLKRSVITVLQHEPCSEGHQQN